VKRKKNEDDKIVNVLKNVRENVIKNVKIVVRENNSEPKNEEQKGKLELLQYHQLQQNRLK